MLLDVNGRVAHLLLRMADDEGGDRITRKLTHHTIAQMIGSSRETVSRTMRNLVERGIIAGHPQGHHAPRPPLAHARGPEGVSAVTTALVTADRSRWAVGRETFGNVPSPSGAARVTYHV